MHEKRFKIDFFANFRKLQKKLPICKKRYVEILHLARAVVVIVEKNEKRIDRIFFWFPFRGTICRGFVCVRGGGDRNSR